MHAQKSGSISSINIMFKTGSINETPGIIGMSHLLEHLILCDKRINKLITSGAEFNGTTEPHITCYYFSCPSDIFLKLVTLFADIMLFKSFDYGDKLLKEKNVVVQEIKNCDVDPVCKLYIKMKRELYANSLGYETVGLEEDIMAITKKQIKDYFRKYYTKSTMVVSIVSDLDKDEILDCLINSSLNKMPVGIKIPKNNKRPKPQNELRQLAYPIKLEKSFFLFSVNFEKKDIYPCNLLTRMLSGNLNARLYKRLRNRGYIYSIKSEVNVYNKYGMILLTSSCDHAKLQKCLSIIVKEFESMKTSVTEKELRDTKVANRGNILIQLETSEKLCEFIGKQYIVESEYDVTEHLEMYEAVTLDELKRVAAKYFVQNNMTITVNSNKE